MLDPHNQHMDVIGCIEKYLKYSLSKGLLFLNYDHMKVEGCTNANWAGLADARRFIS